VAKRLRAWWLLPENHPARCIVTTKYDGHRCKNMARGRHHMCPVHARLSRGPASRDIGLWSRRRIEAEYIKLHRVLRQQGGQRG